LSGPKVRCAGGNVAPCCEFVWQVQREASRDQIRGAFFFARGAQLPAQTERGSWRGLAAAASSKAPAAVGAAHPAVLQASHAGGAHSEIRCRSGRSSCSPCATAGEPTSEVTITNTSAKRFMFNLRGGKPPSAIEACSYCGAIGQNPKNAWANCRLESRTRGLGRSHELDWQLS
jgi:hypothetical protein